MGESAFDRHESVLSGAIDMNRAALGHLCCDRAGAIEPGHVIPDPGPEAQDDRGDHEVRVIDHPGTQEDKGGAHAAADTHIPAAGGFGRLGEFPLDGIVAKMERCSAVHGVRRRGALWVSA